ncbi:hypothetical protein MKZ38_001987 [Zalerion maritima]|uniref:Uncharacterized protein n=1 Tax=Zalerion maritima TaxID=339359 RepID=A0AAD5RR90_9PEZI|nr:hypothetical protein MKZ38_001987 [Zalerion maritima]
MSFSNSQRERVRDFSGLDGLGSNIKSRLKTWSQTSPRGSQSSQPKQQHFYKRCQDFPSRVLDHLPAPFNQLLGIDVPFLTTILTINVRICLRIALFGALILAVVFIMPFSLGLTLLQVIPGLRLAFEVAMFLLAMLPLLMAAVVTISISSISRNLDALKATNGDAVWCLGVTLFMMILSGISFF